MVLLGSVAAQAINLALIPWLARLYSPEAFGQFGMFMAVTSLLATVVTGRYNIALMLPRSNLRSTQLGLLSILVASLVVSLMMSVIAAIYFADIEIDSLPFGLLLLLPIAVFLLGLLQVADIWAGRHKLFGLLAMSVLIGTLAGAGLKVLGGLLAAENQDIYLGDIILPEGTFLIAGSILTTALTVFLVFSKSKSHYESGIKGPSFKTLRALARRYSDLPRFRAPKDFVNSLSQNLPIFLLGLYFGGAVVGLYVIAERLMKVPNVLIGNALRKVFYQRATEQKRQGQGVYELVRSTTFHIASLALLPFAGVAVMGPDLFSLFLGEQWRESGALAQWLALWMYFAFINVPSVVCIPLLGLERFFFKFELFSLLLRMLCLSVGIFYFDSLFVAVALFCSASALVNALTIFLILRACR